MPALDSVYTLTGPNDLAARVDADRIAMLQGPCIAGG